jgi:predicted RNase H-like HicB family nuclease
VIIEKDEDGYYVAECPHLCACYTQGKTIEEALANIRDVIEICLHEHEAHGSPVTPAPEIIGVRTVEVEI